MYVGCIIIQSNLHNYKNITDQKVRVRVWVRDYGMGMG